MTASRYALGIDAGTTSTAAAVHRGAGAATFLLGSREATVPALVFLRDDQALLTGEAAERRGIIEPGRLARGFKRRMGDGTSIVLGHAPYSAERLMAALLQDVAAAVAAREGTEAAHVAVTHPANWGPSKLGLLRLAVDLAGLRSVTLLTEPVAAAVHHAEHQRVEPGTTIAVYDLGGGTFDAVVLRRTTAGFEMLGEPEGVDGIERLGGIDFDEAVFAHVHDELHGRLDELDAGDPSVAVALDRLRRECVGAKESLSVDTETTIPVALPDVHTEIRLTRAELETLLRPAVAETVEALRRAVARAGLRTGDVDAVLLVGGSSQIPLVAQMVASGLGRPVAVGAHPKHVVALGAAVVAARAAGLGDAAKGQIPAPAMATAGASSSSSISPSPLPPSSDPPAGGGGTRGGPGRAADAPALPGQVPRQPATPPDTVAADPRAVTGEHGAATSPESVAGEPRAVTDECHRAGRAQRVAADPSVVVGGRWAATSPDTVAVDPVGSHR